MEGRAGDAFAGSAIAADSTDAGGGTMNALYREGRYQALANRHGNYGYHPSMLSTGCAILAMSATPAWQAIAWISLGTSTACAIGIACDIAFSRRQAMAVMNVVWPITALYAGPLGLLAYVMIGRAPAGGGTPASADGAGGADRRYPLRSGVRGGGCDCRNRDVHRRGGDAVGPADFHGIYAFDFVAAYLFGIIFQYFPIAPMRNLSFGRGIIAAIKADTLALIAFQIGMYAWMAVYELLLFRPPLRPDSPVFWFMMRIGMLAGLATSYPMNWFSRLPRHQGSDVGFSQTGVHPWQHPLIPNAARNGQAR